LESSPKGQALKPRLPRGSFGACSPTSRICVMPSIESRKTTVSPSTTELTKARSPPTRRGSLAWTGNAQAKIRKSNGSRHIIGERMRAHRQCVQKLLFKSATFYREFASQVRIMRPSQTQKGRDDLWTPPPIKWICFRR